VPTNPGSPAPALEESEATAGGHWQWLGHTLATLGDAVIVTDPNGVVVSLNSVAESLTGWTQAEAAGVSLETVFRLDRVGSPATVKSPIVRVFRDSDSAFLPDQALLVARDGTRRPIDASSAAILDPNGDVSGVVKVFRLAIEEVTESKQANAALRKSEQCYRRLFETAKDGILILHTVSGKIMDANPFMTQLLGYEFEEFVGKELWEIGLFDDKKANQAAFAILQEKSYIRYEHLPLATKDGREVEVEFVSNVYPEGEESVIQCNIRDITARRLLERRMEEQVLALAEANRRKDEFIAILSHELRNPLASILNAVQIFRLKQEENMVQQKAKSIIERQVGLLIHLVDDLLEVSRITTGIVTLHLERCEMNTILERAIDSVRQEIISHQHEITVSMPPVRLKLVADPIRLHQVVVNLLMNAAKYTDPGGRIDVTLLQEGEQVVLRVKDTGIGIAPTLLPRIFDLFTQADRSLERSQGGLGIGLTLVHRLVDLHQGTVEAHSAGLEQGSEFVVRLPAEGHSVSEAADPVPAALRVLVVDDNVDYAEGIATLLEYSGYEVKVVHNGPDALQMAVNFHPDAVVLDIGLPGMDGYEVARRLRLDPLLKTVRVIGVSGYRQEIDSPRTQGATFDSFLLKPVLLETLETSLRA
jgi:PAS domain S-box-containing protein